MNMNSKNRRDIKVVFVNVSISETAVLAAILQSDPDIKIIGIGGNGKDAIHLVKSLHPDILLVDLRMHKMGGLEVTQQIMRETPLPIVLMSSASTIEETELTFMALQAGALSVIKKPGVSDSVGQEEFIRVVRNMANVPVIHHWGHVSTNLGTRSEAGQNRQSPSAPSLQSLVEKISKIEVIGIAASTGGPGALAFLIRELPKTFPVPILIVQHMSKGFDIGFAEWLGKQTPLRVVIVSHRERLYPGAIYIAPDDYHLDMPVRGMVTLSIAPPYKGLRPSANSLFHSLAKAYGKACLGVVLTGMGDDGARGLVELHQRGGFTIAQDEDSCVVYGMPKEAVMSNAVDEVLSLGQIARVLEKRR